jgi:MscS family membrane protein
MTHRRIDQTIGVEYSTSLAKLKKGKEIIKNILIKNKLVDKDTIMIAFTEFADSSLNIRFVFQIPAIPYADYLQERDKINYEIKKEFEKAKIVFAFPTQTIELKK